MLNEFVDGNDGRSMDEEKRNLAEGGLLGIPGGAANALMYLVDSVRQMRGYVRNKTERHLRLAKQKLKGRRFKSILLSNRRYRCSTTCSGISS